MCAYNHKGGHRWHTKKILSKAAESEMEVRFYLASDFEMNYFFLVYYTIKVKKKVQHKSTLHPFIDPNATKF